MTSEIVIALVTENLHRRELDRTQPIVGNPFSQQNAANEWLERVATESQLIEDLLDDEDGDTTDQVGELVAFAATAIEMWASHSGHDPMTLLQQIALKSASGEDL